MIVEDSPEDLEATLRAFRKASLGNPIIHFSDGDEALDFLHRRGPYQDPANSPRPGIILLDLNLPGTDGRDILADIKGDFDLKIIPVIVLTTSSAEQDIQDCYRAGANSFILKPVDLNKFMESIQRLKDFWFEVALFPKPEVI